MGEISSLYQPDKKTEYGWTWIELKSLLCFRGDSLVSRRLRSLKNVHLNFNKCHNVLFFCDMYQTIWSKHWKIAAEIQGGLYWFRGPCVIIGMIPWLSFFALLIAASSGKKVPIPASGPACTDQITFDVKVLCNLFDSHGI